MKKEERHGNDDPDAVNHHPTSAVMIIITKTRTKTSPSHAPPLWRKGSADLFVCLACVCLLELRWFGLVWCGLVGWLLGGLCGYLFVCLCVVCRLFICLFDCVCLRVCGCCLRADCVLLPENGGHIACTSIPLGKTIR